MGWKIVGKERWVVEDGTVYGESVTKDGDGNAVTTAPNAAPITTATARSRTLPRKIDCLKPFNIVIFSLSDRDVYHCLREKTSGCSAY